MTNKVREGPVMGGNRGIFRDGWSKGTPPTAQGSKTPPPPPPRPKNDNKP